MSDHEEVEQHQLQPSKKLRSAEPDLHLFVGEGDTQKEYLYHSIILASHSVYIDTMLVTSMKEREERTIRFPC